MRARSHAELFWCFPKAILCVPARTRRLGVCPDGTSARARSHAALVWCFPKVHPCVPARTRRTWAQVEGTPVRARPHAAHSVVARRRLSVCPHARGAFGRVLEGLPGVPARTRRLSGGVVRIRPCVPARTRRTWAQFEGAPVRARSHAAHSIGPRRRFSGWPRARGSSVCVCVCSTSFRVCPLARGAGLVVSAGTSDVPARTWRAWARVEGAPVRARSRADLSWCVPKAARCVHARGALWRIPKLVREARPRASQSRILRLAGGRWAGISWRLWRT